MLRHVALFTWKPGTTAEQVQAFSRGLAALPSSIPEIRGYRFGPDIGIADGNADFALVADFDDADSWRTYQRHPEHQRVIAELTRPIVEIRHAVQYHFDA
jgi:hypothetical protein